jgi:hypothetical protein
LELPFVTDPLESFETRRHPTLAMIREAARRGHTPMACEPQHIGWPRGAVSGAQAAGGQGAATMFIGALEAASTPGDP